ncbi:MAG TPA: S9 family peptidase [Nevskia sp.]|nr:S9 family peptidase [Nevskia sp.]
MNFRALLLAAGGLACVGNACADRIPTLDFFKFPQNRSLKISPKGDYIALTVPDELHTRLAIIKLSDMSLSGMMDVPSHEQVWDFFWVNDKRVVFDTAGRAFNVGGALETPRFTGHVFAANADGSDYHELRSTTTEGTGSHLLYDQYGYYLAGRIPNSDNSVLIRVYDQEDSTAGAYRYNRATINRLNVYSGHREQIAAPPYASFSYLADADGQIRYIAAEDDHDHLITQYRNSNKEDWVTLSSEPYLGHHENALGFSTDKSHVYLGTGDGVYSVDLKTKERKLVSKIRDTDESDVILASDMVTPIGIATEPDYPSVDLFDREAPEARLMRTLLKTFKDDRVSLTSFTKDGKLGVVQVSSDVNPGEFYLVDLEKNSVSPLVKSRPWIDPAKMAPMEAVRITARDGLVLNGYLTVPPGAAPHQLPMVVLVHGGPHGIRDDWGFDSEVQFLANRGYAVLQVNYRGSGGYSHEFKAAGYKHWGTTMQDDVTDATLWAIKDGVADPKRICIAGGSYGGYSALMGVIREPDLYRCAFAYDGVYDLELMFKSGDTPESMQGINYLTDVLGTDTADLRKRSPVYNVDKIKVPLFLAHGEDDQRVPLTHFRELTAALDKAGKPYESLLKSGEEHGFYNEKNQVELYDRAAAFFDKYIGPGAGAPAQPQTTAAATPAAPGSN